MDNKQKAATYDSEKIDISDNFELMLWSDKFDVTKVKLKAAINAVGNSVKDVEAYLKKSKRN